MLAKTMKRYGLLRTTEMVLAWIILAVLNFVATSARFLFDKKTVKNKLYAVGLIACSLPVIWLDNDATATILISFFAIPLFFAKENWIM